jgi:O-antigen ligase
MSWQSNAASLADRFAPIWGAAVPRRWFAGVWVIAVAGYAVLGVRFAFLGFNFHGLPQQPGFWIFWFFAISLYATGWLAGTRFVFSYLGVLPLLIAFDLAGFLPFGNVALHSFNFCTFGWLSSCLIRRRLGVAVESWALFLVGCFAATMSVGTFYSLMHPSWSNSLSVAFSAFGWGGDMNEFNALWMGHHLLAGCMLCLMAVIAMQQFGTKPMQRAILVQFVVVCAVFAAILFVQRGFGNEMPLGATSIPFAPKHDLAGYAVLLFGYFAGLGVATRDLSRRALLYAFLTALALLLIYLSAARSALLVIPLVAVVLLFKPGRWRWPIIGGGLLFAAGFLVAYPRDLTPDDQDPAQTALATVVEPSRLATDASANERLGIWRNALEIAENYPFVGAGLGSSTTLSPHFAVNGFLGTLDWNIYIDPSIRNEWFSTHNAYNAHGDLLEIAVSTGLTGSVLYLGIYFFLLLLTCKSSTSVLTKGRSLATGVFVALLAYGVFSQADSRIVAFPGTMFFWQFVALGIAVTSSAKPTPGPEPKWKWLPVLPALAPLFMLAGGAWTLWSGSLPSDRTHGVWNWHIRDSQGNFLLAREAQFVIPPFEKLEALAFRQPQDSTRQEQDLVVRVEGGAQPLEQKLTITKDAETILVLPPRAGSAWGKVSVIAETWAGRGLLGSPLGVKSYSFAMRKIPGPKSAKETDQDGNHGTGQERVVASPGHL